MPHESRVPPSDSEGPRRFISPPFCRVEQQDADGRTRTYVVHTQSPKFVVEFERAPTTAASGDAAASEIGAAKSRSQPVIRRVCVPNNWAGDYHRCARQLGAAAEFFAATETSEP